jgi:hypothetical protein
MKQELVDPGEDIMPASFALGLAGSIVFGIALWCVAALLLT